MVFRLGVIGTGWISRQFIEAAVESATYEWAALYSRSLEKGRDFATDDSSARVFDNFAAFAAADMDVVYIASPNSLHFEQAKGLLQAGKSVIVEKPAFSNPKELEEIITLAAEKQLFFFEAARNLYETAFQTIKDFLKTQKVLGADLTYAKYSSKMQALLAGELPNKWNPKFSGGILADLGVYCLYTTIGLFDEPEEVLYRAQLLPSGVDVSGIGLLSYGDFDVAIRIGGNLNSYLSTEIYCAEGTLVLDAVSAVSQATFIRLDGSQTALPITQSSNPLSEEARTIAKVMLEKDWNQLKSWQALARKVAKASYLMRTQAGIRFEAD